MKKTLIVLTSVALFSFGAGILPVNTYFAPIKASAQYQNPAYAQTETITADGYGVLPQNRPFGQAKLMARRAAVVEAQRNLLETVKDVAIDSETNVEMSMTLNDTIHSEISGVIRGARVIDEEYIPEDGIYRVTMSVPMYGVGSLGQVVFDNVIGNNQKVPVPAPSPAYNPSTQLNGNYTGLVIRARGAGLVRTFCPAIYDTSGRAIYGVYNVDTYSVPTKKIGKAKDYYHKGNGWTFMEEDESYIEECININQCPLCNSTHLTFLNSGEVQCDSCGSDYFIPYDKGLIKNELDFSEIQKYDI